MELKITCLKDTVISGTKVVQFSDSVLNNDQYFEWYPFAIETEFKTNKITAGMLQGWHHKPDYTKCEIHEDTETFYFCEGDCVMFFIDVKDGVPQMDTAQLVYIPEGSIIEVEGGKGHYVPVAIKDTYKAYVYSPVQGIYKFDLPEEVNGVF